MRKAARGAKTNKTRSSASRAPAKFVYIRKSTMHRESRGTSDLGFVDLSSTIVP